MAAPSLNAATSSRYLLAVTLSSNVTSDGGQAITQRGFNYGRSRDVDEQEVVAGTTGAYSATLNLTTGRWYFRAYATNADGTTYSDVTFVDVYELSADVPSDQSTVNGVIEAQQAAGYYFQGTLLSAKASQVILVFGLTPLGDNRSMGSTGRYRVNGGETATGSIYAVLATSDNFAYGPGCVASKGEAPAEDDSVAENVTDLWPASTVVVKSGSCWVYGLNVSVA